MAEQKQIEQSKPIEQASAAEVGLSLNLLYQQLFKLQSQIELHVAELEKRKLAEQAPPA